MARKHDDATDHVKEAHERLNAEVEKLMAAEHWQRYLRMQSRFHHYSFGNVLLILSQCENPTYLKGFKGWIDLGRCVRKGETAIRILAPRGQATRKETNADGQEEVVASWQRFGTTCIFDISQTSPISDHPAPFDPATMEPWTGALESGDPAVAFDLMMTLKVWAQDQGATVVLGGDDNHAANGYFQPAGNKVWVKERDYPAMFSTLVHEVAHMVTYADIGRNRVEHEVVAESIAFIVCDYFGIESTTPSSEYLAAWISRDMKAAKAAMPHIQRNAHAIIDALTSAALAAEEPIAA